MSVFLIRTDECHFGKMAISCLLKKPSLFNEIMDIVTLSL